MEWNVYYHNINKQQITTLNIFNHCSFDDEVQNHLKKCKDKTEFIKELKSSLFYYFCSKAEYEILIKPWCGDMYTREIKVDIYSQVMLNWDRFVEYVWSFRKK